MRHRGGLDLWNLTQDFDLQDEVSKSLLSLIPSGIDAVVAVSHFGLPTAVALALRLPTANLMVCCLETGMTPSVSMLAQSLRGRTALVVDDCIKEGHDVLRAINVLLSLDVKVAGLFVILDNNSYPSRRSLDKAIQLVDCPLYLVLHALDQDG